MIKAILKLARAFTGIHSRLRRLTQLLEWIMQNGIYGKLGDDEFVIYAPGLPPTEKQIKQAVSEEQEYRPVPDEEELATQHAIDLYKRRARGEEIDESDPGKDWDFYKHI